MIADLCFLLEAMTIQINYFHKRKVKSSKTVCNDKTIIMMVVPEPQGTIEVIELETTDSITHSM